MNDFELTDERRTDDDRPDGCECRPGDTLVCWSCYRNGFDEPNPDPEPVDDSEASR